MLNENKIQSELYHDLSHCVRLFTQKNKCLMRMWRDDEVYVKDELQVIYAQSKLYIHKYQNKQQLILKYWIIIQRFLARIKEMSLNLLLKHNNDQSLSQYLSSILTSVSDCKKQFNFSHLLKTILLLLPLQLQPAPPEKFKTLQPKKKQQTPTQTQLFLKSLQKEYKVFEGLDLDVGDYRRRFFMSREELTRKNNVLLDEMIERNRFIRETLEHYRIGFENYRCKSAKQLRQKKNKANKHTKPSLSHNIKNYETENPPKKKVNFSGSEFKHRKFMTTNRENTELTSPIRIKSASNVQCKTPRKFVSKQKNAQNCDKKTYEEYMAKVTKDNLYNLSKINFFENKIQIGPKQVTDKNTIRKKILFKKTEENVYRKFDFLAKTIKKNIKNISPNFDSLQLIGTKKK